MYYTALLIREAKLQHGNKSSSATAVVSDLGVTGDEISDRENLPWANQDRLQSRYTVW